MALFKITCPYCRERIPINSIRCPECRSVIPHECGDSERALIFYGILTGVGLLFLLMIAVALGLGYWVFFR